MIFWGSCGQRVPPSKPWVPCDGYACVLTPSTSELWCIAGLCLSTESSQEMLRDGSWAVSGYNHRPWRDDFCQCDVNPLLSFYISLYSNPCKAKKQLLIKQSIKLYVVIKCRQSTEHRMQTGSAEGLPPFHRHWSCLSLFFSSKVVQNKYITVFPLNSCLFLGYGSFIMARICHSCRIFKSCLLLSSKPTWEIVCIRYWAQQTTQIPRIQQGWVKSPVSKDRSKDKGRGSLL